VFEPESSLDSDSRKVCEWDSVTVDVTVTLEPPAISVSWSAESSISWVCVLRRNGFGVRRNW
jgi:hypothetical protein